MLHEITATLPDAIAKMPAPLAAGISGAGALLGLFGARLSRAILSLSLVTAGTFVGLQIPKWFGWHVDPMGPAVGVAVVLGLSGYALTQMWEAILLGTLLATVAGALVCNVMHATLTLPSIDWSATAVETTLKVYRSIPTPINKSLPIAVGIGLTIGWFTVALFPKFGRVMLYTLAGTIAFVGCGIPALATWRPSWIAAIPPDPRIQIGAFVALVLVAAMIQWMGIKGSRKSKSAQADSPGAGNVKSRSKNQASAMGPNLAARRFGSSGF